MKGLDYEKMAERDWTNGMSAKIRTHKTTEALSHIATSNHVVELQHLKQVQGQGQKEMGVKTYYFASNNAFPSKLNNYPDGKCTAYLASNQPPIKKEAQSEETKNEKSICFI